MIYNLKFKLSALKAWEELDGSVKSQFKKKLKERLKNPHIPSARLSSLPDCYKIKLRSVGYRLVYQVNDDTVVVTVIAVGQRDKNKVYKLANAILNSSDEEVGEN
ncbi:MAG: type II toxin-antitoxin system RelE/ParE family toxin [Alcaligenaceae bacterium]|nr:type II toxin-antitoxin system RelE/ParE family toxin [Alcaligenaceae bacterium]